MISQESEDGKFDDYIASTLAGVHSALEPYDEEQILSSFAHELDVFEEMERSRKSNRYSFQSNATGTLCLLMCRLLIIVLESPSINHALYYRGGINAATQIILLINRIEEFGYGRRILPHYDNFTNYWTQEIPNFDPRIVLGTFDYSDNE